jgi:hypothetical protein
MQGQESMWSLNLKSTEIWYRKHTEKKRKVSNTHWIKNRNPKVETYQVLYIKNVNG